MVVIRSTLFLLLVSLWTIPFGVLVTLAIALPMHCALRDHRLLAKRLHGPLPLRAGHSLPVIGRENIPARPSIVLAKHQSAWETVGLQEIFPPLVFVLKKELLRVPFFGWGLAAMKMISIDRAAAKDALKQVFDQGASVSPPATGW
jgi:1-acyl-sn-glycerol-3-phosphate acyltransferase